MAQDKGNHFSISDIKAIENNYLEFIKREIDKHSSFIQWKQLKSIALDTSNLSFNSKIIKGFPNGLDKTDLGLKMG